MFLTKNRLIASNCNTLRGIDVRAMTRLHREDLHVSVGPASLGSRRVMLTKGGNRHVRRRVNVHDGHISPTSALERLEHGIYLPATQGV
jgi:hypothetical protein